MDSATLQMITDTIDESRAQIIFVLITASGLALLCVLGTLVGALLIRYTLRKIVKDFEKGKI
jgi:predicted benzoate:H+ symporter BenE